MQFDNRYDIVVKDSRLIGKCLQRGKVRKMENRIAAPKAGEFYRHFKGNLYQVLTTAAHTETGEELVIYQALYGDFRVFARPLSMFAGTVENGVRRFEKVDIRKDGNKNSSMEQAAEGGAEELAAGEEAFPDGDKEIYELLEKFYDTDSYQEKLDYLLSMKGKLTDVMLTNIAVSLDIVAEDGTDEERFQSIVSCLKMMKKYQSSRLR